MTKIFPRGIITDMHGGCRLFAGCGNFRPVAEVISRPEAGKRHQGAIAGIPNYVSPEATPENVTTVLEALEQNRQVLVRLCLFPVSTGNSPYLIVYSWPGTAF